MVVTTKKIKDKFIWVSLAGIEGNIGVIQTKFKTRDEGLKLIKKLLTTEQFSSIIDISVTIIEKTELPKLDYFYSKKAMVELGYSITKT